MPVAVFPLLSFTSFGRNSSRISAVILLINDHMKSHFFRPRDAKSVKISRNALFFSKEFAQHILSYFIVYFMIFYHIFCVGSPKISTAGGKIAGARSSCSSLFASLKKCSGSKEFVKNELKKMLPGKSTKHSESQWLFFLLQFPTMFQVSQIS